MPLDNTASIQDIISTLEELQGINQKADLKSALVDKGINALETDSVAELVTKLSNANLTLEGKRWASGETPNNPTSPYIASVRGLDFRPKYIILIVNNLTQSKRLVYSEPIIQNSNGSYRINDYGVQIPINTTGAGTLSNQFQQIWSIYDDGFDIRESTSNSTYDWIAFE